MNTHAAVKADIGDDTGLIKMDLTSPALLATGRDSIAVKAGTIFTGRTFDVDTPVVFDVALEAGSDYAVVVRNGALGYVRLTAAPNSTDILGGFHFSPGGNAAARKGGDDIPAINPFSVWDLSHRPACPDPRGMALITTPGGSFWCDIYLTGADHLANGTSKFGVIIADGDDPPQKPEGAGRFRRFDYAAAVAVMCHHGKTLLGVEEFFAAAYGVTEKTARGENPDIAGLDAPRTSKFGLMQAAGNMWVWGHDGDTDRPRASVFGGSWLNDGSAGSRCADVAYYWPDYSDGDLGARGRCDHLPPA